jgi:hypothetical protein
MITPRLVYNKELLNSYMASDVSKEEKEATQNMLYGHKILLEELE